MPDLVSTVLVMVQVCLNWVTEHLTQRGQDSRETVASFVAAPRHVAHFTEK